MNKRLVFKLLPVAVIAAIGVFFAATGAPKADAVVSGLTPSTFTATSGTATTFSFIADNSGSISVSATSTGATVALGASCTGCGVSGTGGAALIITPAAGSVTNTVAVSLTCTNTTVSAATVLLSVTQGNSMISTGVCVSNVSSGCFDGLSSSLFTNGLGCGCFNGLNSSSLLLGNNCGCFNSLTTSTLLLGNSCGGGGCFGGFGGLSTLQSQLFGTGFGTGFNTGFNSGCGCSNGFGTTALTLNNCGCVSGFQSTGLLANCGCVGGGLNNGLLLGGSNFIGNNFANNNCTANQVSVTVPGSATCGSTTNVLVSVRNTGLGIALDGTPVVVSSTMGAITPTQTFTSGGIASVTLLLPANAAGTATITAAAAGLTGQASIVVSCNVVPVAPAPIVQPIAVAPFAPIITGPNTGDGGCFVVVCSE